MNVSVLEPAVIQTQDTSNAAWRPLYRLSAVAAMTSAAIIVVAVPVFLLWPPPTAMNAWFDLFQRNPFLGLLDLDLLLVTSYVVMIPLYLALYVALRRSSQSYMAVALAFNLLGAALILAVNPGVAMLTLSGQYTAATTDAQRAPLLAAGQALIVNWSGSAFTLGYLFGAIGILLVSVVMLRSHTFSKLTAYTGLVMGALMLIPASAGPVGLMTSLLSLAPTLLWLILVALRLFQLAARGQSS